MSAESPNHPTGIDKNRHNVVLPQPVTDPTILDSVAGFINEVVPNTASDTFDIKDQIQWAHFENLDWDESSFLPSYSNDVDVPASALVLVLGYTTGVQVWAVLANGEATEIFSWRHGSVKVLRILPAPYVIGNSNRDLFESKRPLIALCDIAIHGSPACSLSFYSLKTGEQVKQIKFKSMISDVVANRRSVITTFMEKIAIFDAFTLEDKLSVTTCYLSPGIQPNPIALGPRWLAFAEKKLIPSRRSSGGNEGEGVQSYTATVLHAAKSLGRGLRELGETVASSFTGNQNFKPGTSPNSPQAGGHSDVSQKGIVTVLDIENPSIQNGDSSTQMQATIAHFVAHTEAIVRLQFDPSGLLLLTADKRGHDFHLFRLNPHGMGSTLAAVHHLYTLHRGDTSAGVQDMSFSFDSRWVTVSTLRGTTHVFPITPYGGNIGVRTHTTPHVVNKMSRFHRSAGLTAEGRSNSPVSIFESPISTNFPYHNPRYPPFPHPTVVHPLAQIRQPVFTQNVGSTVPRQGRQRLSSSSEDNIALRVVACFAPARAWIDTTPVPREITLSKQVKAVESLFIMSCHGNLVQYDLEPQHVAHIPKERVCDDSPIELMVSAKAQWTLQRRTFSVDIPLPLPADSLKYVSQSVPLTKTKKAEGNDDDWLSQVEILTHAGPHRRLWMGPQFTFKTYTTTNGTAMSLTDAQPVDLSRSKPVNMPITKANAVLIESGSASSSEQSLLDVYRKSCEEMGAGGEHQIREDLADAMIESPGIKESGGRCVIVSMKPRSTSVAKVVNPLGTVVTVQSDSDNEAIVTEDGVIYENCDEALFRPMVTPRTLAVQKPARPYNSNIITKSLKSDTEVTVQILNRNKTEKKQESATVFDVKPSATEDATSDGKSLPKIKPPKTKEDSTKKFEKLEVISFSDTINLDFPPLEENFFSLETKCDKFEDAEDCGLELLDPVDSFCKENPEKQDDTLATSEEKETENGKKKSLPKKPRKPKHKLGVKINLNKEKENTPERYLNEVRAEIVVTPPKRTWARIASSSKETDQSLTDTCDKNVEASLDEVVEHFTIQLPAKSYGSVTNKLIDLDTPVEDEKKNIVSEELIKIDKSSDDEKPESGSSPVDSTESDDSGKVKGEVEDADVSCDVKFISVQNARAAKKRVKKKKK
ncbi:breast carcinoma-amplified sequence 3 homolog [Cylas formicarius]|uniref:breast carcinoma-amplified sequence 3 homolog n=1 Tax=Cylas formicarius TaxID=197179 RepID=UPI00295889DC|nr:breast carcinoma-amplified sequence 3 homolog [Cylas formicarius]XP_060532301.1 breast carcinoma-amplified sequence 3 homolog [Cylas formicarius]